MSISVIIPAFKARKFLADCLTSIGEQTLLPDEVLVIDDCSPESIDDIIESFSTKEGYPFLRLLKHQVNKGQAAARNTGIKESKSNWLAFIDCDDLWAPNHLESVLKTAEKSGADLVFTPAILFDSDSHDPDNYRLRPLSEDEKNIRPLSLLNRCFIVISSSMIRSEPIRKLDGFNEHPLMRGVEDLDLFMRLLESGAKFRMDPAATLFYRKHPESATGTRGYLAKQSVYVTRKHISHVKGRLTEKLSILTHTYWRTAIQLWLIKAPDRVIWLVRAVLRSLWNPYQFLRWSYRFTRSIRRNSCNNL